MLYLTKKTDYALNFLVHLAKKNNSKTPINLSQISKTEALPRPFLAKLAADLVKAQILKSKEGIFGGYLLAKDPEKISLADIVLALEKGDKNNYQKCNSCSCQFCTKRDVEKPLVQEITKQLGRKTLADFLQV